MLGTIQILQGHLLITLGANDLELVDLGLDVPIQLLAFGAGAIHGALPLAAVVLLVRLDAPAAVGRIAFVALQGLEQEAKAIGTFYFEVLVLAQVVISFTLILQLSHLEDRVPLFFGDREELLQLLIVNVFLFVH